MRAVYGLLGKAIINHVASIHAISRTVFTPGLSGLIEPISKFSAINLMSSARTNRSGNFRFVGALCCLRSRIELHRAQLRIGSELCAPFTAAAEMRRKRKNVTLQALHFWCVLKQNHQSEMCRVEQQRSSNLAARFPHACVLLTPVFGVLKPLCSVYCSSSLYNLCIRR